MLLLLWTVKMQLMCPIVYIDIELAPDISRNIRGLSLTSMIYMVALVSDNRSTYFLESGGSISYVVSEVSTLLSGYLLSSSTRPENKSAPKKNFEHPKHSAGWRSRHKTLYDFRWYEAINYSSLILWRHHPLSNTPKSLLSDWITVWKSINWNEIFYLKCERQYSSVHTILSSDQTLSNNATAAAIGLLDSALGRESPNSYYDMVVIFTCISHMQDSERTV